MIDQPEAFVVKHYNEDERPIIKGNGFDGLEIGYDRQEAEEFVQWVNLRLKEVERLRAVLRDLVQLEADGRTEYESAIEHWDEARAALKGTK